MRERIKYKTKEEREAVVADNVGRFLVETQNHNDGDFLVFSDEPRPDEIPTIEERVAALEGRVSALETPTV